jgi:hypothetical protein
MDSAILDWRPFWASGRIALRQCCLAFTRYYESSNCHTLGISLVSILRIKIYYLSKIPMSRDNIAGNF